MVGWKRHISVLHEVTLCGHFRYTLTSRSRGRGLCYSRNRSLSVQWECNSSVRELVSWGINKYPLPSFWLILNHDAWSDIMLSPQYLILEVFEVCVSDLVAAVFFWHGSSVEWHAHLVGNLVHRNSTTIPRGCTQSKPWISTYRYIQVQSELVGKTEEAANLEWVNHL